MGGINIVPGFNDGEGNFLQDSHQPTTSGKEVGTGRETLTPTEPALLCKNGHEAKVPADKYEALRDGMRARQEELSKQPDKRDANGEFIAQPPASPKTRDAVDDVNDLCNPPVPVSSLPPVQRHAARRGGLSSGPA